MELREIPKFIGTHSGKHVYVDNPDPKEICLEDISHALSNQCRFTGQCEVFYAVSNHCLLVSRILKAQGYDSLIQLAGLAHDSSEAYIADLNSPVKRSPGLEGYIVVEGRIFKAIETHFGFASGLLESDTVKTADLYALTIEAKALFNPAILKDWTLVDVPKEILEKLDQEDYPTGIPVKELYISEFKRLYKEAFGKELNENI